MFEFDMVIMPRCISNVHWTCVVLDINKQHIYYYDSLQVGFRAIYYALGRKLFHNMVKQNQVLTSLPMPLLPSTYQVRPKNLNVLCTKLNGFIAKYPKPQSLLPMAEWGLTIVDTPKQKNNLDCGIFTIMCAILLHAFCMLKDHRTMLHNDFESIQCPTNCMNDLLTCKQCTCLAGLPTF